MSHPRSSVGGTGSLALGAFVLTVSLVACGDNAPNVAEQPAAPDVAEQPADRWTEEDIEYKLAVIDQGGFVSTDDPVIDRYAAALDGAEAVCPEGRTMLSDIAVRAVQLLDESVPAHSENALSMLQAITQAASGNEDLGIECTELAATIIILIEQG